MLSQTIPLINDSFDETLLFIKETFPSYTYNYIKHRIELHDETHRLIAYFRLPLKLAITNRLLITNDYSTYIYLAIESGSAGATLYEGDDLLEHKTFSAYMVRKQQGKSQVKYLKTKGKSRAGSRVRLASTELFFEEINERLQQYFNHYDIQRIAISSAKTLLPFFYRSKTPPPFSKDDNRIYNIPLHLHQANYQNLCDTHASLNKIQLFYTEEYSIIKEAFFFY